MAPRQHPRRAVYQHPFLQLEILNIVSLPIIGKLL
jgi:hypothetical protein